MYLRPSGADPIPGPLLRISQVKWCGGDSFDGCLLFDECHKAKNLTKGTKVGLAVQLVQERLPNARVIYCSATGVSDTSNMAYMGRLGLWGAGSLYPNFDAFSRTLNSRGMGAMEMLAGHLKVYSNESSRMSISWSLLVLRRVLQKQFWPRVNGLL